MFIMVCVLLLFFPYESAFGAKEGLRAALEVVVPSILPFAAAASAFTYSGGLYTLRRLLAPLFRCLGMNTLGGAVMVMSFLGGYPTGCKMVCDLYKEGVIQKKEAERMLAYSNNGGIMFALRVCADALGSKRSGWYVFFAAVFGAVITLLIYSRGESEEKILPETKKLPFMAVLGKSVASTGSVLMSITASFVIFYAYFYALRLENMPFLGGLFEITQGIGYAGDIDSVPLAALFFTFGGMGVFAQSAAICADYNLGMKHYIRGKIISSAAAFASAAAIWLNNKNGL